MGKTQSGLCRLEQRFINCIGDFMFYVACTHVCCICVIHLTQKSHLNNGGRAGAEFYSVTWYKLLFYRAHVIFEKTTEIHLFGAKFDDRPHAHNVLCSHVDEDPPTVSNHYERNHGDAKNLNKPDATVGNGWHGNNTTLLHNSMVNHQSFVSRRELLQ